METHRTIIIFLGSGARCACFPPGGRRPWPRSSVHTNGLWPSWPHQGRMFSQRNFPNPPSPKKTDPKKASKPLFLLNGDHLFIFVLATSVCTWLCASFLQQERKKKQKKPALTGNCTEDFIRLLIPLMCVHFQCAKVTRVCVNKLETQTKQQ